MFVLDVAMSVDGYWADARGESVFPLDEMHGGGLVQTISGRAGAAVLSRRSFEMVEDSDWYADNYELQVPLFVVTDSAPSRHPKENDQLRFTFVDRFGVAFEKARAAAGVKDVVVIGEASAVRAAFERRVLDEIFLRVVARTLGGGFLAFQQGGIPAEDFDIVSTSQTASAVHIHLRRRLHARSNA